MPSNDGSGSATTGEMLAAQDQAQQEARVATFRAEVSQPEPVIPKTSAEAAERLAELKSDPKWVDEYLGGSARHAKEMRGLQAVINKGGNPEVDRAIAGVLDDAPFQSSKRLAMIGTANFLRDGGISDGGVIRQVLAGDSVTAEEHAAATEAKARLMRDQEFVTRYTDGDGEARRQMTLLNVVLSSRVKEAAA